MATSVAELATPVDLHQLGARKEKILSFGTGYTAQKPADFNADRMFVVSIDPNLEPGFGPEGSVRIKGGYCYQQRRLPLPEAYFERVITSATFAYIASEPLDPSNGDRRTTKIFAEVQQIIEELNSPMAASVLERVARSFSRLADTRSYRLLDGRKVVHEVAKESGNEQWRLLDPTHLNSFMKEIKRVTMPGASIEWDDFVGPGGANTLTEFEAVFISAGFTLVSVNQIRGAGQTSSGTIRDNFRYKLLYGTPYRIRARRP
ncbi:MAG: hypothetical protein ACE5DX_01475 [Candidatus Dojkabacteria bacterium]